MRQQDGEMRKPSSEAEALSTEGTCTRRLAQGSRPNREGLESHAHPTGLQFAGKKPYLWSPYAPQSPFLCPSTVSSEVGCYNLTRSFTQAGNGLG